MSTLGQKIDWIALRVVVPVLVIAAVGGGILGYVLFYPNQFTDVGYEPKQPIAYSHKLHAGDLKISCFYCHGPAEKMAQATLPATQICMNCHSVVKRDSLEVQKIVQSFESGTPIAWVRIHKLADFVHFKHNVHIRAGVSCFECHGRVDQMEVVRQEKPLNMGWCLDCHRQRKHDQVKNTRLEDLVEKATKDEKFYQILKQRPENFHGISWRDDHHRKAETNCSACHY